MIFTQSSKPHPTTNPSPAAAQQRLPGIKRLRIQRIPREGQWQECIGERSDNTIALLDGHLIF